MTKPPLAPLPGDDAARASAVLAEQLFKESQAYIKMVVAIAEGVAAQTKAHEALILRKLKLLERQTKALTQEVASLKLQRL